MRTFVFVAFGLSSSLATLSCSNDDSCGQGTASPTGLTLRGDIGANNASAIINYADLVASQNNDCPDPNAPAGVISLTIEGEQLLDTAPISFCIPRPDLLGTKTLQIGTDVQLNTIDANNAGVAGCTLQLLEGAATTGTVTATGVCDDGVSAAGFAITFNGMVTLQRTCGTTVDMVMMNMVGTSAVSGPVGSAP